MIVIFRELTRKKQQLSEEKCIEILKKEPRGVLSVHGEEGYPYGMPVNYFYDEESGHIYFHGGKTGHRIDAVNRNNKVSFCVYDEGFRKDGEWALNISSVIVFGKMYNVTDEDTAMKISRTLSLKYTKDEKYIDDEIKNFGKNTLVQELVPEYITGKLVNES